MGNTKLGWSIWTWSLPAVKTCPGRSDLCEEACYARKGHYRFPNSTVQRRMRYNLRVSRCLDFADRIVAELQRYRPRILRVHVSGDFYDVGYAEKWLKIFQACPGTKFFFYTRSWRIPEIRNVLTSMARQRNVYAWWSTDRETGAPRTIPSRIRLAYMAIDDGDQTRNADLIFRVQRKTVLKRHGPLVCAKENGVSDLTCERCSICYTSPAVVPVPDSGRRLPLPLTSC